MPPLDDTDDLLVARVQDGDKRAFDLLVRKYQVKVAHLVGRYIRWQCDIEDLTQEAFLRAYQSLPTFRGDSAFYSWLYRITINTVKNHYMIINRRPWSKDGDIDDAIGYENAHRLQATNTPEAALRESRLAERIHQSVDALRPELREAIMLREVEGMSYKDVALAMETPIGTVRSRIYRARQKINNDIGPLLE